MNPILNNPQENEPITLAKKVLEIEQNFKEGMTMIKTVLSQLIKDKEDLSKAKKMLRDHAEQMLNEEE